MAALLEFKNNFLDLKAFSRVSLRFTLKTRPLTYILILPLISLIGFWALFSWKDQTLSTIWANTGLYVWFMTILLLFIPFSTWRSIKKSYASARFMHAPVNYQFSDEGLEMHSTVTQVKMAWGALHGFYDLGRYGVLLSGTAVGFFLDFESLQLPNNKQDFLYLLKQHQVPVK